MKTSSISLETLSKRIEQLESQQHGLLEALKLLLPMTIAIAASTDNSAQAIKTLQKSLSQAEDIAPRSEDFWYLASTMLLALSSRAIDQYPNDPEVVAIFQGLRAHKMQ